MAGLINNTVMVDGVVQRQWTTVMEHDMLRTVKNSFVIDGHEILIAVEFDPPMWVQGADQSGAEVDEGS